MKTMIWMAFSLLCLPTIATAQARSHASRSAVSAVSVEKPHGDLSDPVDSLALLRDSIFGDAARRPAYHPSKVAPLSAAQLFLPLTFYKGKVLDAFSLSGGSTGEQAFVDSTLLGLYVRRPDLVRTTSARLRADRSDLDLIEAPIQTETEMGDHADPMPVEPDVVPVQLVVHKPNFWHYSGYYSLRFMQNYVSDNWYKGGESNYSALGSVIMEANYNNKQKVKFDNKLEMKLGFQTSRGDTLHSFKTSEDLIRYTGRLGLQASKKWYYSLQLIAYTQFARGFKSNDATVYSDILSPLNVNVSVGMDYNVVWLNKRLTGTIQMAPLAYNFRYVGRKALATRYGLKEGDHTLNDFGSECTIDLTWAFAPNIKWKTRLYGYTTYKRAELEWENTLMFQFNKYISSNVFVYPRFDDGAKRDKDHGYWQLKEYASIGFTYSF